MIIPKEHLAQVDYYTVKYKSKFWSGRKTVVTLHYKKWYKLPKRFVFNWLFKVDGRYDYWEEPKISRYLQAQLARYFGYNLEAD